MSRYLDSLFLKDYNFDEALLASNLFISFDKTSALRKDYNIVLEELKRYSHYEIKYVNNRELNEGYDEEKYILLISDVYYFVRIVLSDKKLYDVLVYTIEDINKYVKIFFSAYDYKITDEVLEKINQDGIRFLIDLSKDGYYILKANDLFYNVMMYEDWDFYNKYLNKLMLKIDSVDLCKSNNLVMYKSDGTSYILNYDIEYINENVVLVKEVR